MPMSLVYYLNKWTNPNRFGKLPGSWRVHRAIKDLFLTSDSYYKVPYFDHHIYICPAHSMGKKIFNDGIYEPAVIRDIQTLVSQGYSFIDIGANVGLHTLAAAFKRVNKDQFFDSYEPEPNMFQKLKRNCISNNLDYVNCVNIAIGEIETYLPLNISATNNKGLNSFFPLKDTIPSNPVKVTTIDNLYLNKLDDSKRVLIKMDTEGYELPIIRGGINFLSRQKEIALICEISPSLMHMNGLNPADLFELLRKCGFYNNYEITDDLETAIDLGKDYDQSIVLFYKGDFIKEIIRENKMRSI